MWSECPDLPIILSSLSFEYQSHPYTSHLSNCQGKEICMPHHLEHQQHLLVAQANFPGPACKSLLCSQWELCLTVICRSLLDYWEISKCLSKNLVFLGVTMTVCTGGEHVSLKDLEKELGPLVWVGWGLRENEKEDRWHLSVGCILVSYLELRTPSLPLFGFQDSDTGSFPGAQPFSLKLSHLHGVPGSEL